MNYHYLVVDSRLKLWNYLHMAYPITPEEAFQMVKNGAYDIIDITNPKEPRSLIVHQEN